MKTLEKWATGRNIILFLVLVVFINLLLVPAVYPKFQTLDTLSTYTPEQAYRYISSYGAEGRGYYALIELTLDLAYPFVSAMLFSLAIFYTFSRGFPNQPWTRNLAILPVGVIAADYLENICIVVMLFSYPVRLPLVAAASNVFTVTKFALSWFELIFVVGLVGWLVQYLRRSRPPVAAH